MHRSVANPEQAVGIGFGGFGLVWSKDLSLGRVAANDHPWANPAIVGDINTVGDRAVDTKEAILADVAVTGNHDMG